MSEDFLDYPQMVRNALRWVPREALKRVSELGLPAPHHFYLSFRTDHPGVVVPNHLREQYPGEMTVVLQHQYHDLEVDSEGFSVTLYFGGRPEPIHVPFAALTAFIDPSVEFGLRFEAAEVPPPEDVPPSDEDVQGAPKGPADVVSIEKFRKK